MILFQIVSFVFRSFCISLLLYFAPGCLRTNVQGEEAKPDENLFEDRTLDLFTQWNKTPPPSPPIPNIAKLLTFPNQVVVHLYIVSVYHHFPIY